MNNKDNLTIIALGGSIIVSKKIQSDYLKRLKRFLEQAMQGGKRFIVIVGGGSTARNYQNAASSIVELADEDKDWLGIHSTRLNAHLLRTIFQEHAYPIVLDSPEKPITKRDIAKYPLFIASGWRPGWSTDYIAFRLARRFGTDSVLVATTTPYVYESDVRVHKNARPIKRLSWKQYMKLLPADKWHPGMRIPVDPVAARFAQKHNIACTVVRGTNLQNLERVLGGKKFQGTVIT